MSNISFCVIGSDNVVISGAKFNQAFYVNSNYTFIDCSFDGSGFGSGFSGFSGSCLEPWSREYKKQNQHLFKKGRK